jgi:hypothetical protein
MIQRIDHEYQLCYHIFPSYIVSLRSIANPCHGGSVLHGESHHKAAGHQRNWKTGPPNKQTNKHGQYTHNAILLLQEGIHCILVSQFNPSNLGKGIVEKLLKDGTNLLTNVKIDQCNHGKFCPQSSKSQSGRGLEGIINNDHSHHHLTIGGTGGS